MMQAEGKTLILFLRMCSLRFFGWIDFFLKLNDIWGVIWSCMAPNVVYFTRINNWIDY